MSAKLRAVSLFSGCGGFDWGAASAGLEIIWANDINKNAEAAYRSIFPNVDFVQSDIRDIEGFPKADVLIGCYPCTGFSLAARRRWKKRAERNLYDNPHNFLYREFIRALRQVEPRYLFIENVGGMSSASNGWFLQRQIQGFRKLHYKISYKILNACDYGVAQTRKRLFIVGVRNDVKGFSYEFETPSYGPESDRPYRTLKDEIGGMPKWPHGEYIDAAFHGHYLTRNRKRGWNKPSYTIVADGHHVPLHPMGLPMQFVTTDSWKLQGQSNRRLSWRECLHIQGLPARMTLPPYLAEKYLLIGNAVPPTFGKILLKPVVEFES